MPLALSTGSATCSQDEVTVAGQEACKPHCLLAQAHNQQPSWRISCFRAGGTAGTRMYALYTPVPTSIPSLPATPTAALLKRSEGFAWRLHALTASTAIPRTPESRGPSP